MLQLYHLSNSSNAQRVRIALAEKNLAWESHVIQPGEQHAPHFRALSPTGTVPVLRHDGRVLVDSVVINEYLEDCFPLPALRPEAFFAAAEMRQWTKHADDFLQGSIAVFTHALVQRPVVLAKYDGDIDAAVAQIDDPILLVWRRDVYANGLDSPHADRAMRLIQASLLRLASALEGTDWILDDMFSLADIALLPAIYRLECLEMDFLWKQRYPAVQAWLNRGKDRQAFQDGVTVYLSEPALQRYRTAGAAEHARLVDLAEAGE